MMTLPRITSNPAATRRAVQRHPYLFGVLCLAILLGFAATPVPCEAQDSGGQSARKGRKGKSKGKRGGARGRTEAPAEVEATEEGAGPDAPAGDSEDAPAAESLGATPQGGSLRRSNRMEFDARLVRGETAGTGAVVLFDRGQRQLPPLTRDRTGFLGATIAEVYDALEPAVGAQTQGQPRRAKHQVTRPPSAAAVDSQGKKD